MKKRKLGDLASWRENKKRNITQRRKDAKGKKNKTWRLGVLA